MQDRTGLTVFLVRVVFVLFETRRFCKVARFVFPDLIWSFQTGLNFISKGVKGDGVTDAWDVVDVTINQLYLELPLMVGARIHTASNFDLLFKGGPYLAYGVGGKTKIDGVSEKADTFGDDGLKRFDAGLGLGVAFEFGNIVVGVETGTSFTKVASGVSAHNLSALATIGYKF